MFTHIQAIDLFKQVAVKHLQIRSMGAGDYPEIGAEKLILAYNPNNINMLIYPLLWVVPTGIQIETSESILKYAVLCMDLVNDTPNNLQDVLNDTMLILHDVNAVLQAPDIMENYALGKSTALKPFTDSRDDAVAGWEMEVSFRVRYLRDRCAAVMSSPLTIPEDTLV